MSYGSRGLDRQICTDHIKTMLECLKKYAINVPDRQLACAPVFSREAQDYLGAMRCAANFAWANRQILMQRTRECFEKIFKQSWENLGMSLIYDVAHNSQIEPSVHVRRCSLWHRKCTRRLPGIAIPTYRSIGQPDIPHMAALIFAAATRRRCRRRSVDLPRAMDVQSRSRRCAT